MMSKISKGLGGNRKKWHRSYIQEPLVDNLTSLIEKYRKKEL